MYQYSLFHQPFFLPPAGGRVLAKKNQHRQLNLHLRLNQLRQLHLRLNQPLRQHPHPLHLLLVRQQQPVKSS